VLGGLTGNRPAHALPYHESTGASDFDVPVYVAKRLWCPARGVFRCRLLARRTVTVLLVLPAHTYVLVTKADERSLTVSACSSSRHLARAWPTGSGVRASVGSQPGGCSGER
jgi:hypothetical protein